jgi:GxxExxY protein
MQELEINQLTEKIIGLAIKVHRTLGPGFLESVYQAALAYEFQKADIPFEREKSLSVTYESIKLDVGFRCDFLVDDRVVVETKAVTEIHPIEKQKLLNYLKATNCTVGLLINFNERLLKNGLLRVVNNFIE